MRAGLGAGLAIASLAGLLLLGYALRPAKAVVSARYQCADLRQACAIEIDGQPYRLRATPEPSALKPFRLSLSGPAGLVARVRFGMVGMEMGPIAFPLQPQADGSLAADIVLPYCVQGRRDWWLQLEAGEQRLEVAFVAGK